MRKTGMVELYLLLLLALFIPWSGAFAATDGYYQLSEVSQPSWDGTDADRTETPTADYNYVYGNESSVSYTLPWSFTFYGHSYSAITPDTNGNIWFNSTGSANSFNLASTGRGPVIAAWNNDLSSYFNVGVFIQHKTNPERVVIEWQTETYTEEGFALLNNFEVVIFQNGSIRTDYGTFNTSDGIDFGSGISQGNGSTSLSLTANYGNAFTLGGRSFLFSSGQKLYVASLTENFAATIVGTTSQPQSLTVTNGGTNNLLVNSINLSVNSSLFSIVNGGDGCSGNTLAPSQSCAVQAVFAPTAVGPQSATLSVSSNDPTNPLLNITLTGNGLNPTLTVTKADIGTGTVTSSPGGISCGTTCTGQFTTGSSITLTATPDTGSLFTGWSGACSGMSSCNVTMNAITNVTASFTPTTPPTVTIVSPSGNTVSSTPVLQYTVSTGTVVATVDGVVVNKVSGNNLGPLSNGTHVVNVQATNLAGLTGSANSTFTVNTTSPTVTTGIPAAGAQNVPVNTAIVLTFSETLSSASVTNNSIVLSSAMGQVPGTVTLSANATTLTFTPLVQLAYNRVYTITLKAGIQDLLGNSTTSGYTSSFTTQVSTDFVGLWHMDGDWSDSSGNGRNGTAYGGATFSTDHTDGIMSGNFTGTSDYVSIGNLYGNFPNNAFTIESWVKLSDTGNGARRSIAGGTGSGADYSVGLSNNQFVTWVYNGSGYYAYSGTTPNIGQWYHIAGTFDGNQLKLYVNGVLMSNIAASWGQSNGGANFWIGSENCCGGNNFNGLIDNLSVHNRALTAQEILNDYNATPKVALSSPGQTANYTAGETGTATVTVTHPVGVSTLNCSASGAASGNLSLSFDPPQTQVTQIFAFQIAPIAEGSATVSIACSSTDTSSDVGSADLSLTVANTEVPIVISTSIQDNATNVPATSSFTVNFSDALASSTVNTSSVTLMTNDGTNQTVSGTVSLSSDQKSITFTPTTALNGNTAYLFTISTVVTDTSGNPLLQGVVLHFTTQSILPLNLSGQGTSSIPYLVSSGSYTTISINSSYIVFGGPVAANSMSLTNSSVTVAGAVNVTGALTLSNGSVLTHNVATTTTQYELDVTAASVSIDATSKIDVSGKGYLGGYQGGNNSGTGMTLGYTATGTVVPSTTGGSTESFGGSYGGLGGVYGNGSANLAYGTMQQPGEIGSGGGYGFNSGYPGGNGGGLVKLTTETLSLSGSILANGGAGSSSGGGSGGGILINVGTLSGTGTISACGGSVTVGTTFGSGGGGRIAIYYGTNTLPTANIVASGGQSGNGTNSGSNGGAGTIYLQGNAEINGDVIINNAGIVTTNATIIPGGTYDQISGEGGAVVSASGSYTTNVDMVLTNSQMTVNGPLNLPANMTLTNSTLNVTGGVTVPGNLQMTQSSLSIQGTLNVSGNITLQTNSVLSHYGATTTAQYELNVTAASVSIDATSKIDVSGKGYLGGYQGGNSTNTGTTFGNTTTGGSTEYSGGSYAGLGGISNWGGTVNASYGNMQQPGEVGSGGSGGGNGSLPGGNGGGLVQLTTGTLSLSGSILANGGAGSSSGGGSGGGILINAGTLSGTGTISASGGSTTGQTCQGSGCYGSGGGGRIAIYYGTNTLPTADIVASSGQSGNGTNSSRNGGAGTIYLKNAAKTDGDVIVNNGGVATSSITTIAGGDYDQVSVTGGAQISVTGNIISDNDVVITGNQTFTGGITTPGNLTLNGGNVTVAGAVNVTGALTLTNGSVLTHLGATTTAQYELNVTAASVSIDATSKIDVSGKGYLGGYQGGNSTNTGTTFGNTTTGGSTEYSGGSYAGLGGISNWGGTVNASYGNMQQPGEVGSGGSGGGNGSLPGGNGGGLVQLTTGTLSLSGSILANGGAGSSSGGGSGGGILINAGTLSGTGTISASGGSTTGQTCQGSGCYGSGGGGRIAIYYGTNTLPTADIVASSGQSGNGTNSSRNGGAGTIYLKNAAKTDGDVIVNNGGVATSSITTIAGGDYDQVSVTGGAQISVTGNIISDNDVVITGNQTFTGGITTPGNLTLNGGNITVAGAVNVTGNLTLNGGSVTVAGAVNVTGALALTNGSVLTQYGATTTAQYALNVTAASVSIDSTSKIDVSGKGYLGGYQGGNSTNTGMTFGNTTTGGSTQYTGGSYGGLGGISNYGGTVNATYGNMQQPGEVGSGGGGSGAPGGDGGGLVKLTTGTLSLYGSILANGGVASMGCGSGGGILINAGTLSGSGTISASGGSAPTYTSYGSGGGGRIAVYYGTNTLPTANIVASGGQSGNGSVPSRNGGAGTIYLKDNAKTDGDVIVNNGGIATSSITTIAGSDYDQLNVTGGAQISVTGNITFDTNTVITGNQTFTGGITTPGNLTLNGGNVTVAGAVNVTGTLSLTNGSVLTQYGATTTAQYALNVTAASVSIDSTSKIDVSGKGYLGGYQGGNSTNTGMTFGNTTTGGSTQYTGGSYGGLGGISNYGGTVNATYGNMQQPGEVGSGGGGSGAPGGDGGGLVKLTTGTLSLYGSILANGGVASMGCGSGGGILINAGTLSGSGTISASGGSAPTYTSYGSGGGGRIAVYYGTNTLPTANIVASGGQSGNGSVSSRNGGAGTIYMKDNAKTDGDVIVNNGGIATSSTTTIAGSDYDQLSVSGGAQISVTGNIIFDTNTVITGNQMFTGGITTPGNLTLNGANITVAGAVNVTGTLTLTNGSVLTQYGATTTTKYELDVTAASVSIDSTSKIDVSGKGYLGGYQGGNSTNTGMTFGNTTTGGSTQYTGGSYGGLGGISNWGGTVNATYGNMQQPGEVGSGGGASGSAAPGGDGGGLVKLTAGTLSLSGSILANGGVGSTGCGSGGGILLNAGTLSGSGTISASGGSAPTYTSYGSGGGGRIAVYYGTNTLPTANIVALGGQSGNGSISSRNGGAGTVYLLQIITPPTVTITSPVSGTSKNKTPLLSYSVSGGTVVVKLDGAVVNKLSGQALDALADGTHTVVVQAIDIFGNTTSASVTFTVLTVPPTLTVNQVNTPTAVVNQILTGNVGSGAAVTISSTSGASAGIISYPTSATWSCKVTLAPGTNIFTLTATDPAGNLSNVSVSITYTPILSATLSPTTITSGYQGSVVLSINNITTAGSVVFVEQFVDANNNGVIDAGDFVIRSFKLTDGTASVNPNVQGDEDGAANSSIVTTLNYYLLNDLYHAPGQYIFRVTSGSNVAMAPFTVTALSQPQSIAGAVTANSAPVPGAIVQLADNWLRTVSYTLSDANGLYTVNVPSAGNYLVTPLAYGYVAAIATTPVSVAAGQTVSGYVLTMTPGVFQVTGQLIDSSTGTGINGVWVNATSSTGNGVAITGSDGSYGLLLPGGSYAIAPITDPTLPNPSAKGYLGFNELTTSVNVTTDINGSALALPQGNSLISGTVSTGQGTQVQGIPVQGMVPASSDLRVPVVYGVTNANGNYTLAITAGNSWNINLQDSSAQILDYIGTAIGNFSTTNNSLTSNNLTAYPITAWVQGTVTNSFNQPLPGVNVTLRNADSSILVSTNSAVDGTFRLGTFAGNWFIDALTINPVTEQNITLANLQTAAINFTEAAVDISSQVSVTPGSIVYSSDTMLYTETMTITNNGADLPGTKIMALSNLTTGVSLTNATGTYQSAPYVTVSTTDLAPGASATVQLIFSNPANATLNFTPVTYQE
jgi:hypothetical protein